MDTLAEFAAYPRALTNSPQKLGGREIES
jgi:hypothetical protein